MEELNLKQIIEKYPDCLHNPQKLKGIIFDLYPNCPRGFVRVIVDIAECRFFREIQLGLEVSELKKSSWVSHLENEVGCSPKLATNALNVWLDTFKKDSFTVRDSDDDIFRQAFEFYNNGQHEKAVDLFLLLAEQGHIEAQYLLASCYKYGKGVPVDQKEAAKWYRKAAEQGDTRAQLSLGVCYKYGAGVPVDQKEAAKWYRKAAEQGDTDAQLSLGVCYENGEGVPVDEKEAVKWYRKAVEQGDARAQYELGRCYAEGKGVHIDEREAVKWYRKAADQGGADGLYALGRCYVTGCGVLANNAEAVKWYHKAAERESIKAQYELGRCYAKGVGVPIDEKEAVTWYRKAAESWNANAQYYLGRCYAEGKGVEVDDKEAVKWYRKAAKQGNADAQYFLGLCYAEGKGIHVDEKAAVKWYRKAEEQGNANARYALSVYYRTGQLKQDKNYLPDPDIPIIELKKTILLNSGKIRIGLCDSILQSCFCNDTRIICSLLKPIAIGMIPSMFNDIRKKAFIYGKYITVLQREENCSYGEALKIVCFWRECFEQDSFVNEDYINGLLSRAKLLDQDAYNQSDYKKSLLFFCRAAVQGNAEAQFQLGYCFENGWGVKVDCDEAMFWYVRATKHKHDRAASYLYQLAKEYYGLTADQVKFFCDLKEDGSIF